MTQTQLSMTEIVKRIENGSSFAQAELFHAASGQLVSFVQSLYGPPKLTFEDADEIAAEALYQFLNKVRVGDWRGEHGKERAYALLRKIAKRRAIDFLRKSQPIAPGPFDVEEIIDDTTDEGLAVLGLLDEIEMRLQAAGSPSQNRNRSLEIAQLLLDGATDRMIQQRLKVSSRTVFRRKAMLRDQLIAMGIVAPTRKIHE